MNPLYYGVKSAALEQTCACCFCSATCPKLAPAVFLLGLLNVPVSIGCAALSLLWSAIRTFRTVHGPMLDCITAHSAGDGHGWSEHSKWATSNSQRSARACDLDNAVCTRNRPQPRQTTCKLQDGDPTKKTLSVDQRT